MGFEFKMPEVSFTVKWPDGEIEKCYSPSTVILNFLEVGKSYPVQDFVKLSNDGLELASQRVMEKYGFRCTSADSQISRIMTAAKSFKPEETVTCICMK